jgi:predicted Zn-dependent protease
MTSLPLSVRPLPRRRLLAAAFVGLAVSITGCAQDNSRFTQRSQYANLVPAEQVEQSAEQQYSQLLAQARQQHALAGDNDPRVIRVRAIAKRLIVPALRYNQRASQWQWQVNVIGSKEINAFCMPGGKIAVYTGLLDQIKPTDDELAMVMGHEMSHALLEHAREQMGKAMITQTGASLLSSLFGLGNAGQQVLGIGTQLLSLRFSREDETQADLLGMELAARAGYDPHAAVSLWHKMEAASKGAPPQWLSTHPSSDTRVRDIEANLPSVMPIYERAPKPPRRYDTGITP